MFDDTDSTELADPSAEALAKVEVSIDALRQSALAGPVNAAVNGQVEAVNCKHTREQKPYIELGLRDLTGKMMIRVWNDHPSFEFCSALATHHFVRVEGEFVVNGAFGLEARNWTIRELTEPERELVLNGSAERIRKQRQDYAVIEDRAAAIADPRLRELCRLFLEEFGERFRRAAGARSYHHARRGGLVEHVAQMLRAADAICSVYPDLNADLLAAGVVFHDSGKMWENNFPKDSLVMSHDSVGELVGHIAIGTELVNRLWLRLRQSGILDKYKSVNPEPELVRLHLLHLVAAHHGEKQFGSPIEPKTPEAWALHVIDNLDAKLDVMASAYSSGNRLTDDIVERVRPLPTNLIKPLPKFNG